MYCKRKQKRFTMYNVSNKFKMCIIFINIFTVYTLTVITESSTSYAQCNKTSMENINYVSINQSSGLQSILSDIDKLGSTITIDNVISILEYPMNDILEQSLYNKSNIIIGIDPNNLKIGYNNFGEHEFSYSTAFTETVPNHIAVNSKVVIISYNICQSFLITNLLTSLKRRHPHIIDCYSLDWYDNVALSFKASELYKLFTHGLRDFDSPTRAIIALNTADSIALLQLLHTFNYYYNVQFITIGISNSAYNRMKNAFPTLKITNVFAKQHEDSLVLTSDFIKDVGTIFAKNTSNSINSYERTMLTQDIYNSIKEQIPQNTPSIIHMRKRLHLKTVSNEYAPYMNVIANAQPNNRYTCSTGHPCTVPRKDVNGSTIWKRLCCNGLALEIFDYISKQYDFTYDLYLVEDNYFGGYINGSWNGVIRAIVDQTAHVGIQFLTPTFLRSSYVNFTPPVVRTHYVIIRRKEFKELKFINWDFLEPLDLSMMLAIIISTLLTMLTISIYENIGYFIRNKSNFSLREVLSYISGLTFQRDLGGKNPIRWSGRLAAIGYAATMTVVMTTYTAHITAKSIVVEGKDDFKGFHDHRITNPTKVFTFGTVKNAVSESMFRLNPSGKFNGVWKFIQPYRVKNDKEGMEAVYSGKLDGFITDEDVILSIISKERYCNSLQIYHEDQEIGFSFGLKPDFKFGEEISKSILKYRENGVIEHSYKKWMYIPKCGTKSGTIKQFSLKYFGGLIIFVGYVVAFCIIVVLSENLFTYYKTKSRNCILKNKEKEEESYESDEDFGTIINSMSFKNQLFMEQ